MSIHGSSADADTQPGTANTVADILTAAADLISGPGAWTKGAQARNRRGTPVPDGSPDATCFCASGAIWRAAYRAGINGLAHQRGRLINDAHRAVCLVAGGRPVPEWNDAEDRTQAEVLAALRQAAEKARQAVSS